MYSTFVTLNWWAVLLAACSGFAVGSLWYGPWFGKAWMQATGISKEKARSVNMTRTFGLAFVLNLLCSFGLAVFLGAEHDLVFGVVVAVGVALAFVSTAFGVTYLFEQRPLKLFFINAGYQVANFAVMGAVIGAWV
jgi:hypothetical protein